MWRNCTVCSADLGGNVEVEHFQVGTRLAFDSARGRLWVICPNCERWNLSPLDIRWEALEDLERLWEKTKVRVSSDRMALGRTPGGMWLVRVGNDGGGGEFAFWRWGRRGPWHRRFGGKNAPWWLAAGVAGAGLIAISPPVLPVLAGAVGLKAWFYLHSVKAGDAMVSLDRDGQPHRFTRSDLRQAGLTPADDELGWSVQLQRWVSDEGVPVNPMSWRGPAKQEFVEYRGHEAEEIARRALPLLNNRRFRDHEVSEAVKLIEETPIPNPS